jgi:hypothetical protein
MTKKTRRRVAAGRRSRWWRCRSRPLLQCSATRSIRTKGSGGARLRPGRRLGRADGEALIKIPRNRELPDLGTCSNFSATGFI